MFEIFFISDMRYNKVKAQIMVPKWWLFTTHDMRKIYVPNPNPERARKCEIWKKPEKEDKLYVYY